MAQGGQFMKRLKLGFVFFIALVLVVILTSVTARAGNYLGEFCWNFTNTTFETTGIVSLGVEHIGDSHYLCSGKVTVTTPISLIVPVFGNAEIFDGKIVLTITVPGRRNGNLGSEIAYISLDPSNYSGTIESIGIFSDKIEVSQGMVTLTTCPGAVE
jgi:hypothetical protein